MSANSNDKNAMLQKLATIHQVEGFDPTPFAVEYQDLNTGETRKRLPVMIQMAWFRLKYPEGKISVQVSPIQNGFVATAKVYPHYNDAQEHYLAEASASRFYDAAKPQTSPREWAQTAAVGIALRNAGFGLQFHAAGESFDMNGMSMGMAGVEAPPMAPMEAVPLPFVDDSAAMPVAPMPAMPPAAPAPAAPAVPMAPVMPVEETPEQKLQKAMQMPCPIGKYRGKTLGDLITLDPNALNWIVRKCSDKPDIQAAAKLICDYAVEQASA
ncbi:MAG: hypothetical protein MJ077_04195 [Oscillospiraceae bacterium]|nr:hypothetical protein [Oscillospiraceae bacterium]